MRKPWTFEQKIVLSYLLSALLVIVVGVASYFSIEKIVAQKDDINGRLSHILVGVERLRFDGGAVMVNGRNYFLTENPERFEKTIAARDSFCDRAEKLKTFLPDEIDVQILNRLAGEVRAYVRSIENAVELKRTGRVVEAETDLNGSVALLRQGFETRLDSFWKSIDERTRKQTEVLNKQSSMQMWLYGLSILLVVAVSFVLGGFLRKVLQERKSHYQNIKQLSYRLQLSQEEERRRISREIHDELGQLLTIHKMELFDLRKRIDGEWAHDKIRYLTSHVDEIINSIRKIANDLRPVVIEDLGLVPALEWLAQDVATRTGIDCKVSIRSKWPQPSKDCEIALFRIAQEAITNAARYSGSKAIEIEMESLENNISLKVRDHGQREDVSFVPRNGSVGIIGMRERAQDLGGRFQISNQKGKGTEVFVTIPFGEVM